MSQTIAKQSVKKVEPKASSGSISTIQKLFMVLRGNAASSHAKTKTRGLISGGGKKPFKQKGTGNARAGSTRSPLWRGGGITFGPVGIRGRSKRVNAKERIAAITQLIDRMREQKALYIKPLVFEKGKTKLGLAFLQDLGITGRVLIVTAKMDRATELSFGNISYATVKSVVSLNLLDLISFPSVVFDDKAWEVFEAKYYHVPVKSAKKEDHA